MTETTRRVAERYGSVAREYRRFWAPAMVALSRPLIRALPVERNDTVVDLGCGVGVIGAQLARRARRVAGIDVAEGMLRRAPDALSRVGASMTHLPFVDAAFDGAISTYALQHVRQTGVAFKEAARVLRPGGFIGTATWGVDHAETGGAYQVVEELFARHRIPEEPPTLTTYHDHVDEPAKLERHARRAGLTVERSWTGGAFYDWPTATFIGWVTTMGPWGRRLATMPDAVRARLIEDLHNDLKPLPRGAFRWAPQCVYMIAVKQ